jgi:hypothetical protein
MYKYIKLLSFVNNSFGIVEITDPIKKGVTLQLPFLFIRKPKQLSLVATRLILLA